MDLADIIQCESNNSILADVATKLTEKQINSQSRSKGKGNGTVEHFSSTQFENTNANISTRLPKEYTIDLAPMITAFIQRSVLDPKLLVFG